MCVVVVGGGGVVLVVQVVFVGLFLRGEGEGGRGGGRGFGMVDQLLTERGLQGGQEKKEGIKEKRFDTC